jgi:hypothetical protein
MLLLHQINIFPNCRWAAVSRWCTFENFRTTVILLFQDNLLFEVVCRWINFVTFVRFFLILVWKTGTFLQILNLISMLRMQEMVLAGFKFQKFSGGAWISRVGSCSKCHASRKSHWDHCSHRSTIWTVSRSMLCLQCYVSKWCWASWEFASIVSIACLFSLILVFNAREFWIFVRPSTVSMYACEAVISNLVGIIQYCSVCIFYTALDAKTFLPCQVHYINYASSLSKLPE